METLNIFAVKYAFRDKLTEFVVFFLALEYTFIFCCEKAEVIYWLEN